MIDSNSLHAEAAAAAAGLGHVRVVEREAALVEGVVEVDRGSVEVEVALLVDCDRDTVLFDDEVLGWIGLVIKAELVLEAAASATRDADSQNRVGRHLLLFHDSLDFFGCVFRDCDHVSCFSCVWKGRVEVFEVRGDPTSQDYIGQQHHAIEAMSGIGWRWSGFCGCKCLSGLTLCDIDGQVASVGEARGRTF